MDNTEYEPCAESQHKDESVSEDMHQVFDVISEDEDLFWNAVRSLYDINVPKEEEERRLRKATEFIDYAEIDFKSAKSLYDVSIFSTSIYHLQQSIKKIVKAYMAYLFNQSNKDFKNIRHDSPKAFFKLLQRFKSYLDLNVKYLERSNRSHTLIKKAAYGSVENLSKSEPIG